MVAVVAASAAGALDRAAAALRAGQVVVVPTDTVYGVAVDPSVPGATGRLFAAKRRPRDVPLPVLVAEPADATRVAVVGAGASALIERFWPGALTVVMPRRPGLAYDLGIDEATVGVRCPDHEFVRELCRRVGPLAVTSANRHGEPTPGTATGVAEALGDTVALVVDAGSCEGSASTVVDCTGDRVALLREGSIPFADLAVG